MQLAKNNNVLFKEVSAKNGGNIQEFFKEVASLLPDIGGGNNSTIGGKDETKYGNNTTNENQQNTTQSGNK